MAKYKTHLRSNSRQKWLRDDVELEHLIDHKNALQNEMKPQKEKSAKISPSLIQCIRKRNKCKITLYVMISLLLISYCVASYFIDVPYWILHGFHYHLDHFQWHSSINGEFCDNRTAQKDWTYTVSQNNTDFNGTRSRVLLLSYPRSGNHLTKAMLECLLQQQTYAYPKEKHDGKQQEIALREATVQKPYIRKIHSPHGIHQEFNNWEQWGLIYLIRDPIEALLSENKYVPYFWKDYEYQFGTTFMKNALFYGQWSDNHSKVIIFYDDYFNGKHGINLRKLANYFGEDRVSLERVDFCIEHFDEIINAGLQSLDRKASSNTNTHFYRDKYFGTSTESQPVVKVPSYLYQNVFSTYENFESC